MFHGYRTVKRVLIPRIYCIVTVHSGNKLCNETINFNLSLLISIYAAYLLKIVLTQLKKSNYDVFICLISFHGNLP